jgi:hypothetical protein
VKLTHQGLNLTFSQFACGGFLFSGYAADDVQVLRFAGRRINETVLVCPWN